MTPTPQTAGPGITPCVPPAGSKLYAETLSDAGLPLPYAPGVVESLAQDLARQFWG